jgi:hypothetical protein
LALSKRPVLRREALIDRGQMHGEMVVDS